MRTPVRSLVLTLLAGLAACAPEAPSTSERVSVPRANAGVSANTIVLTGGPAHSTYGYPVTLDATVTGGSGTPSGDVTFRDAASVLCENVLDGTGHAGAVLGFGGRTSPLPAGDHCLTAQYGGDLTYAVSTSACLPVQVSPAVSTTTLIASPASSVAGQPVVLTASVTGGDWGVTPTGTVSFSDDGAPTADCPDAPLVDGTAHCYHTSPIGPAAGNHSYRAQFRSPNWVDSEATIVQVVQKASATVALEVSPQPSMAGQPVTLTAQVAVVSPGQGIPTGVVNFRDQGASLATADLQGDGTATLVVDSFAVGSHSFSVDYLGDSQMNAASTTLAVSHEVERGTVAVAITPTSNPSHFGEDVTFTVGVTAITPGTRTPTGTVTVRDGGNVLAAVTLVSGTASFHSTALVVGSHALTASYPGDESFLAGAGTLTQHVDPSATQLAVTSSRQPSRAGRPVTFTATVTSANLTPTGSATFKDGEVGLGTVSLTGGVATLTVRSLRKGTHAITAEYEAADGFAGSTGTLAGGEVIENTPPVAGSGSALALGDGHASAATGHASDGALDGVHTVELWARPGSTTLNAAGASPTLLRLGGTAGDRFALGVAPDRGSLALSLQGTETQVAAALDDGAWHHLALVDAGGQVTAWVDGSAAGVVTDSLADGPAAQVLVVGEGFTGEVDEVRLWSSARTAEQLVAEALQPIAGTEDGLIGLWRMDEGEGTEAFDASPSHVDLTLAMADGAAGFVASGAWSARATREERALDPIAAGYDADGDPLTVTISAAPAHGTATLDAAAGQIGYLPAERFLGDDELSWTVSDGTAGSSYTVGITVSRILTCAQDSDCGGGDVCVVGVCTAPKGPEVQANSGGCSTGGGTVTWSLLALAMIQLSVVFRRGRASRSPRRASADTSPAP